MLSFKWQEGRQPRRLLCFSAAFFVMALVTVLLFVQVESPVSAVLLSGAAACLCAVAVVGVVQEQFRLFTPLFLGLLVGWLWCSGYVYISWHAAQQWDGLQAVVRFELDDYAEGKASYGIAFGRITERNGEHCNRKVKVYLQDGSPDYAPGDVLIFEGAIHVADRQLRANLLQQGCWLTVTQEGSAEYHPGSAMNVLRRASILSHHIAQSARTLLPGDEGALLAALLSGRRDGFSTAFDRALNTSGTRHITAVSGLHVMTLAGLLLWLFGKRAGLLMAVPVSVAYAAVTGFSPSVVRAVVLLLFWSASFLLKQEKDSLTALAAALLVLVASNPFSAVSASLLLSFAATLGIILLSKPLYDLMRTPLPKLKRGVLASLLHYFFATVSTSLAATLFTMPLNLLFFDTVPLVGVVSNLLILWALSAVLLLGIAVLLAAVLWMPAAQFLASSVLYWPLTWTVRVIRTVGSWRFAATDSANLFLCILCLSLLAAILLWRGKYLTGRRMLALCGAMICIVAVLTTLERMHFGLLEVSNYGGQPVFLLRGEGISLLNTGTQGDYAAEMAGLALDRWNASELETVLCTTEDYRTQGGLRLLLEESEARRVLLPSMDGMVPYGLENMNVSVFSDSGTVTVSGVTVQLLRNGKTAYAMRLLNKHFSLVSLCGLKAADVLELLQHNDCKAGILVVDDALANDWQVLYDLCQLVLPEEILVITNGYSEHADSFAGVPLTLLERDTVRFRFMR